MPEPSFPAPHSRWPNGLGHRNWRAAWELPGGKVAPGETEREALARELAEELRREVGDVAVGERLGDDISLNDTTTLRAYRVRLIRGEPHAHDHRALRWVTVARQLARGKFTVFLQATRSPVEGHWRQLEANNVT